MVKITDCPFPVKPRQGFTGIFGGTDPEQEASEGYYEGDRVWMDTNREACIWFLRQMVGDPCHVDLLSKTGDEEE